MLTCLVIAGSLWIGDYNKLYPTQVAFYFHKFQQVIKIYGAGGNRHGSLTIPKEYKAESIAEVLKKCSEDV